MKKADSGIIFLLKSVYSEVKTVIYTHRTLWGSSFGTAWESLPFDKKLAWILFLNNTIAIISLIEIFALKRH
jgi:hypothetical protein